jgi:uncharacterized protein YciI
MCVMDYCEDKQRLASVRPRHRDYLRALIGAGKVLSAGSFVPEDDGGLFLYEAPSHEEAEKMVRDDPYVLDGVAVTFKLREYEIHGVNPMLLRVTGASKGKVESSPPE